MFFAHNLMETYQLQTIDSW